MREPFRDHANTDHKSRANKAKRKAGNGELLIILRKGKDKTGDRGNQQES